MCLGVLLFFIVWFFFFFLEGDISSWIYGLCLTLIWGSSQRWLLVVISSVAFSFGVLITHILHFFGCPTILDYGIPFFSVWKFLLTYHSSSEILSLLVSSLVMSPSKTFFISVTVIFIANITKNKNSHFCDYIIYLFLHMSTFSIKIFSMLVIVTLNSLSDNFNISAICDSASDAYSVSSNHVFFLFSMPCSFLLKAGHDVLYKRNSSK